MRILGVDPGTVSFDLCLLDNENVIEEDSIPSTTVAEQPEILAQKCLDMRPDVMIAPSGYGLPNRRFKDLTPNDMFELTLVREGEIVPVLVGMQKFFQIMTGTNLDILFIPGIIQLPTVPKSRKYNKIDMGTADKLCIGALSVETVSRAQYKKYSEISHVVVEIGGGYNALISIHNGQIINGIGGTLFPGPCFMNAGALDGELAYLLGKFEKTLLFQGGASNLAEKDGIAIESFTREAYPHAFDAFIEGILQAVCSQQTILASKDVYVSGRLSACENIYQAVKQPLEAVGYKVERLARLSEKSKVAAQGYAVVGNGLCGGCFQPLVKHLQIDKAAGSVLDYVYWRDRI